MAASDSSAPSVFDPTVEYLTEQVVLFWRPSSNFSQLSPSSLIADNTSYSCEEEYMMAEKTRIFNDLNAVELIMSSPGPRRHKRIGRGVHYFDSVVWDRVRKDVDRAGIVSKFTQNPVMK